MPTFHFSKKKFLATIFCVFVVLTAAGWFFTASLVEMATRTVKEDVHDANLIISLNLINELKKIQNAAVAIAGSPLILPVLQANVPENLEKANNMLDRHHKALDAAACYIINFEGLTLASSNRMAKDSFVGQNYTFRPYFLQAIKGVVSQHFAFGTVSKKRGIFASAPVKDKKGNIVGVAVVKKEVEDLEASLQQYIWFLVDKNGIIFMSSDRDARLKSLWPLDNQHQQKIISSKQYGPGPFAPVMSGQFRRGKEVSFKGEKYFAEQMATPYEGVSVVLLWPTRQITNYLWFGIVLTGLTILLTLSFLTAIYIFTQSNLRMKKLLEESRSQAAALAASEKQLTERKDELESQKERLIQAEGRSRLILGSMQEGIWGLDTEGRTTFVNRASLDMLDYTEEEVIGRQMHALVHYAYPDGSAYPLEHCHMYKTFLDGTPRTIENEVLWRKDGSSFPVEYTTTPIMKKGTLEGSVVTFHDITERKKAEEAIQVMAERYHMILASQYSGILVVAEDNKIEFANQIFCEQFGLPETPAELSGLTAEKMLQKIMKSYDNPTEAIARIKEIVTQGKSVLGEEILMSNGHTYSRDYQPILIDGKNSGRMWQHRDVTESKKIEKAILEAKNRTDAILRASTNGIVTINEKGMMETFNPAAEKIFGYALDEVAGKNVSLLMPDEHADKHDTYLDNYLQTGIKKIIGKRVEVTAKRKNGELFPVEIGISEVLLKDAKLFTAIINDITERRKAEKELQQRMEELERFNQITINRELKMIELKEKINSLLKQLGKEEMYKIVE